MAILFGESARGKLLQGMKIAHDAILPLYGTKVRGFDVIKQLKSTDPSLTAGLHFMRKTAESMHQECGDGVKLTLLLLYKMVEHSVRELPEVIQTLQKQSHPISSEGIVHLHSGLITPYFTTDIEWDNVHIVTINKELSTPYDVLPHLSKKPLLLIARDIKGDALATLVANPRVCPIKSDQTLSGIAKKIKVTKHSTQIFTETSKVAEDFSISAPSALFFAAATAPHLRTLLTWPLEVLLLNQNLNPTSIMSEMGHKRFPCGFNYTSTLVEDLFAANCVDPLKLTITALELALKSAQTVLSSETLIVEA